MAMRWFSVFKEEGKENYTLPTPAESYDAVIADAVRALSQYSTPQRWRKIPLVDPMSAPETEEELHHLVMTVPLFSEIFKAGQDSLRPELEATQRYAAALSQGLSEAEARDEGWPLRTVTIPR